MWCVVVGRFVGREISVSLTDKTLIKIILFIRFNVFVGHYIKGFIQLNVCHLWNDVIV